jgi:hypothetical protein
MEDADPERGTTVTTSSDREKIEEFLARAEQDFSALKIASPWDTVKPLSG